MNRPTIHSFTSLALLVLLLLCVVHRQAASAQVQPGKPAAKEPDSQKLKNAIALATSAGPAAISKNATIIGCGGGSCADMNELAKGPATELRAGRNDWVCYALKDGPMCLDREWRKWMEAWMSKS